MSCSGQHFSIHSPDCKAHMSIQSNRPIQVDPLASNSRVSSAQSPHENSQSNSNPVITFNHLSPISGSSAQGGRASPSLLQIQTLSGGDCSQVMSGLSPVPSGGQPPLVGHHQQLAGDGNYTLVILDCSPHPSPQGDCANLELAPNVQQRLSQQLSSVSCESLCRDCHSGCHCQTELIVRQQIEHDHSCQHQRQHQQRTANQTLAIDRQNYAQNEESNRLLQQFGSGSIADRSASQATTTTTTTTTTMRREQNQQSGQQQLSPSFRATSDESRSPNWQAGFSQDFSEQRSSPQHLQTRKETTLTSDHLSTVSPSSNEHISPVRQQQQQQQEQQGQQQKVRREPREGTRIVKRWNWNQAQFVEEEVPDRPTPKPQLQPDPPTRQQQQQHQQNRNQADLWNQEIQSICSTLSPVPPARDHYDPSWLAYRKPDEESVQADPLYRDLMLELQKLEEGVTQQQAAPEPIVTPDCFQKPAFGQPIQPESVELEEHENVEFIARLIPNSDPTMRVEWTKNGRPLLESSRLTCEYEFGVVRLAIRRCEAEDSGIYQCRAANMLGEAVSRSKLLVHAKNNVQYDTLHPAGLDKIRQLENPRPVDYVEEAPLLQPPKFLSHIQDYVEKDEGDSVHFECCLAPVDDPDMRTEWFFNGRPLVTGSRFHTIDDFGFIVLDIDWLFPRDTGEYICRATNKHGTSFTRTVLRVRPAKNIILDSQLDNADATIDKLRQLEFPDVAAELPAEAVNKPAHFVQPLRSANNKRQFVEGDNVHFEARAGPATDGQLSVEWLHNGKPLISGHRFKPTFDFGHILLDILYVYPEDSGLYKCVARNGQGEAHSELEIQVQGKQSIVYQSQLPREMLGGVDKITEMEAMWNRPPDPEEEEAPAERLAPQFVLKPKPCAAFEGSCARFCCRILAHPRPRVAWFINGQLVVSGSRYKLTHDGMYHLIIPKCLLADAGKVEVRAKNLLGECACETQLDVKRKVDDYRGVLKNSPNPWYDEQTLKLYRRQRNQPEEEADDEDFEEFLVNFQKQQRKQQQQLKIATEVQSLSPQANQLVGYMEPDTPDVNLLATLGERGARSPLVEPGDLHPVVIEQQAIHAPAPSTIKWALEHTGKDSNKAWPDLAGFSTRGGGDRQEASGSDAQDSSGADPTLSGQQQRQQRQTFGVGRPQQGANQWQSRAGGAWRQMPPASPENVEHGKEIHSHFHTQLQVERRQNKEITREIIEKETFEQEHKGFSKESLTTVVDSSASSDQRARSVTPIRLTVTHGGPQAGTFQQQQQVLVEEHMIPPEFVQKIQPCQAIDGDEARFECQFRGEPQPTISWYRESKLIKPSNLYAIETDLAQGKSTLVVKRVTLNGNAVYTVKAENAAGSAKSSANLVVEQHPLPQSARGGQARQFDALEHLESSGQHLQQQHHSFASDVRGFASPTASDYDDSLQGELASLASRNSSLGGGSGQKVIKSVRTRRMSPDELASLIRASPDNLVAPTFLHTIHEVHAKLGELARLDARLIGSQPMEVKWLRDGQRVRPDKQHKLLLEGDLYTLLILECSERDEGHYECVASNAVGEARCGASLRVSPEGRQSSASSTSPSYVMQSISSAGGGGGSGASASGGQPGASWRAEAQSQQRQSGPTTFASSSSSVGAGGGATTIIQKQQVSSSSFSQQTSGPSTGARQHFGLTKQPHHQLMSEYTSSAEGGAGERAPQHPVPKLMKGLENQQVMEGKSVTLRCQISAFPKAEVTWFRQNDKQIKPSKYFRIFKDNDETHCLRILETFPEDQGEYKCVARAQNGQIETRAFISVLPSSPK